MTLGTMKRIAKLAKDSSASEVQMELDMSLLVQSVQDIDLLGHDQFKDYWPSFIKSCLKYGLKPDYPSFSDITSNKYNIEIITCKLKFA